MGRTEYYYDPAAPAPNSLVPASNLLIANEAGEVLLIKRSDTGQWAIPGGKQVRRKRRRVRGPRGVGGVRRPR